VFAQGCLVFCQIRNQAIRVPIPSSYEDINNVVVFENIRETMSRGASGGEHCPRRNTLTAKYWLILSTFTTGTRKKGHDLGKTPWTGILLYETVG
jgi:hypothetical protein